MNDTHPLQESAELRLMADVLELGHLTSQSSSIRPIPMVRGEKAQRFIVIGTPAQVTRLLEAAPAETTGTPELLAILFDGSAVYAEVMANDSNTPRLTPDNIADVLDAIVRLMRRSAKAATGADHDHSEGGHHD